GKRQFNGFSPISILLTVSFCHQGHLFTAHFSSSLRISSRFSLSIPFRMNDPCPINSPFQWTHPRITEVFLLLSTYKLVLVSEESHRFKLGEKGEEEVERRRERRERGERLPYLSSLRSLVLSIHLNKYYANPM
ncbi:hypothetical protein PENTCL1PPCAC_11660, partial [Pristionchus entomophagus]